jgi:hypothetical protein
VLLSRSKKIAAWVAANVMVLIGLPVVFAMWLRHEVSEEYRLGIRTSTDADTWAIPVFGLFLWLLLLLVVSNGMVVAVLWARRRRAGSGAA